MTDQNNMTRPYYKGTTSDDQSLINRKLHIDLDKKKCAVFFNFFLTETILKFDELGVKLILLAAISFTNCDNSFYV